MSESEALLGVLRQSADADCVAAIERAVAAAPDRDLCRINVLAFAAKNGLDEECAIAAFLHAARLGLFELSWNVICPGCGGVLDASSTLKTVNHDEYTCTLCAAGYQPTPEEEQLLMGGAIKGLLEHPTISGTDLKGESWKPDMFLPLSLSQKLDEGVLSRFWASINQPMKPAIQCWTTVPIYPAGEVEIRRVQEKDVRFFDLNKLNKVKR